MSSQDTALRIQLERAMRQMEGALERLLQSVYTDRELAAWAWRVPAAEARRRMALVIGQIEYEDGQAPNEAVTLPGLLGASADTLMLAQELNQAKDHLRYALKSMDGRKVAVRDARTGKSMDEPLSAVALRAMGRARLHRLQAWRHLVVFEQRPERLGFTWAHTRKVSRLLPAQAGERLRKLGDGPHIQAQLRRLAQIPPDEALAEVLDASTHVRANVVWRQQGQITRRQVRVALPLLYPARRGEPLPVFSGLPEERGPDPDRLRRMDVRLEDEPLLPSIHVHRYLPAFRRSEGSTH